MADVTDNGQPDETQDEEYPVCAGCGERHAPPSDNARSALRFLSTEVNSQLTNQEQVEVYATLTVMAASQLSDQHKKILLVQMIRALDVEPQPQSAAVDLSRFTPRGQPN